MTPAAPAAFRALRSILMLESGGRDVPDAWAVADAVLVDLTLGPDRGRAVDDLQRLRHEAPAVTLLVQISPLACGEADAELDLILPLAPDALVLPDVVGGPDIARLGAKLAVAEAEHGAPDGATRIIARPCDNAAGLLALPTLPGASPRLTGVLWDEQQLAADVGAAPDSPMLVHARLALLVAARAAGVPAFEGPCPAESPAGLLLQTCAAARRDGFAGRIAASPAELAAVNAIFAGAR